MALLDTIQEIEERRDKTLEGRQRRMAQGEPVKQMPISREQLRMAMSNMDRIFKENRAKFMEQQEQRDRVSMAVAQMNQAQPPQGEQGQQAEMQGQAQPQMQQGQSPLMEQMAPMMNQGAMGGMGQAPAPQPQQQQQMQQQQMQQQQQPQGLLGMGR